MMLTSYNFFNNNKVNYIIRKANLRVIQFPHKKLYCNETRSRVNEWFFNIDADNIYINGYFQSEVYFQDIRDSLITQFIPSYESEYEYLMAKKEIDCTNSVAVHVRRGDFLKAQFNHNPHHYLLGEEYYKNAITFIDSHLNTAEYYWFSDDIEWVKNTFGNRNNFHFVTMHTKNPDIDELMLMKSCKHIIAANSTFSWWAAWLNENLQSIVIVPDKRYGNESMIPDRWIKISVN